MRKYNCRELIYLSENTSQLVEWIIAKNINMGLPQDTLDADDYFLIALAGKGSLLRQALRQMDPVGILGLKELDPTYVLNLWAEQTGNMRGAGKPQQNELIYLLADEFIRRSHVTQKRAFTDMILPYMMATKQIPRDSDGSPIAEKVENSFLAFRAALKRIRKGKRAK